jgi:hypothetical protein
MRNIRILMSGCFSFIFVLLVLSYMLFVVDVVMVFHERVHFKLGVPKEFWDL